MSWRVRGLGPIAAGAAALSLGLALAAGGPSATTEVNRERIGTDDTLVVTVRVEGEGSQDVGAPRFSTLSDFRIVRGPSVSTQFQWVNGRAFSFRTYSYVFQPQRAGTLRIPEATLEAAGGVELQTHPVEIEVVQGSVAGPQGGRPGPGLPDTTAPRSLGSAKVFIEAELNRKSAFVGQQVVIAYRIYTQAEVTGLELADVPSYPGFWVEDLKVDPNPAGRRAVRDGESYTEYTVMKKALFPTQAGHLEIPSLTFSLGVRGVGGDPFESLFFGSGQTLYRKSSALALEVRPIPEEGKPASFDGAVGKYRLSVTPDRQEARVNDAISLRVQVSGEGNLRPVGEPHLPEMADFKAYDPKVEDNSSIEGDRLRASKTWDYVLLPLAPGSQEIPPVEFSYFDPTSARFHTLLSKPILIEVERGETPAGATLAAVQPRDVEQVRSDIRHLHPTPERLADRSTYLRERTGFLLALALPAAINLLLGLGVWRRETQRAEPGARRRRQAARRARRALQRAAAEAERSPSAFFEEVSKALRDYVADKLDRSAAGLTIREIDAILEQAGVGTMDRGLVRSCLEACDRARFAPSAARPAARAELVGQARGAVDSLESRL